MTAEPVVRLSCESHTYPDGTVGVHDVDFAVHPDESVALVGPNGGGKSTLLEHLNGTLVPDDGELVVDGDPVEDLARARRTVGFVFQDADAQLVAPTVVDDVAFGPLNAGVPAAAARERAHEALDAVDAAHLADRVPHHLSGGEKRLVALAGVLVLDPSVVVLDEPFAALDPAHSQLLRERLRDVRASGTSVVLSTHDLDLAATFADRVVVLADGRTIASSDPRDVFYDDALLERAGLHPPTAVRVARETGVAAARPVTTDELVAALETDSGRPPSTEHRHVQR